MLLAYLHADTAVGLQISILYVYKVDHFETAEWKLLTPCSLVAAGRSSQQLVS